MHTTSPIADAGLFRAALRWNLEALRPPADPGDRDAAPLLGLALIFGGGLRCDVVAGPSGARLLARPALRPLMTLPTLGGLRPALSAAIASWSAGAPGDGGTGAEGRLRGIDGALRLAARLGAADERDGPGLLRLRRLRAELWRSARSSGDGTGLRATFAAGVRASSACLRDTALRDAAVALEGSARAFGDAIAALRPSDAGAASYVAAVGAETVAAIAAAAAALAAKDFDAADDQSVADDLFPMGAPAATGDAGLAEGAAAAAVLSLHAEQVDEAAAALQRFESGQEADACLAAAAALLRAIAAEREAMAALGAALAAGDSSIIAAGLQAEPDADAGA